MMYALRSREAVKQGRNQLFVDKDIFPQTLDVLLTRSEPFGIELIIDDYSTYEFKKNRLLYFTPDYREWEDRALAGATLPRWKH